MNTPIGKPGSCRIPSTPMSPAPARGVKGFDPPGLSADAGDALPDAVAAGQSVDDTSPNSMGDLRLVRNAIIHSNGVLRLNRLVAAALTWAVAFRGKVKVAAVLPVTGLSWLNSARRRYPCGGPQAL